MAMVGIMNPTTVVTLVTVDAVDKDDDGNRDGDSNHDGNNTDNGRDNGDHDDSYRNCDV